MGGKSVVRSGCKRLCCRGQVVWAALLLAMFALGFSLPLGAVLLGVSLGITAVVSKNVDLGIRRVSGCVRVVAGFYLLVTG